MMAIFLKTVGAYLRWLALSRDDAMRTFALIEVNGRYGDAASPGNFTNRQSSGPVHGLLLKKTS